MFRKLLIPFAAAFFVAAYGPASAEMSKTMEKASSKSVDETVEAFLTLLESKGATVFATVPHHKGAEKVGMEMKPATLVIFGNPKLGTPLMQLSPTMGLDLPLKALFYEAEDGKTAIIYPNIKDVAASHGVDASDPAVQKVAKVLEGLTNAVAK